MESFRREAPGEPAVAKILAGPTERGALGGKDLNQVHRAMLAKMTWMAWSAQ